MVCVVCGGCASSGREDAFAAAGVEECRPPRPGQQQRAGHQQEQQQQEHAAQAEEQRCRRIADAQHQQLQPSLRGDRPVEEPVSPHVLYILVCIYLLVYAGCPFKIISHILQGSYPSFSRKSESGIRNYSFPGT